MKIALVRPVSPTLADCELTHLERTPIDVARASAQHREYERRLSALGATIIRIPAAPELPDAVFVEDAAIVLDELAVITRPGAASRRPETASVAAALAPYRDVRHMAPPATLDGGDVLTVGRTLYVGRSERTSGDAIAQLRALVGEFGYSLVPVAFRGCLHLKSAATQIGGEMLLLNPDWVDQGAFGGMGAIAVDPREPHAANALRIGETLLYPASHPRTRGILERGGFRIDAVEVSELEKAEAGVTCCSLIFDADR
jgi:dimethylargininase